MRGSTSAAQRIVQCAPSAQLTLQLLGQVTWHSLPDAHDTLPLAAKPTSHVASVSQLTLHESPQLPVQTARAPHWSEQLVGPHELGEKRHIVSDGQLQLLPLQSSSLRAAQPASTRNPTTSVAALIS